MGVAPAKSIKMILEEQARRTKSNKGEASQAGPDQSDVNKQETSKANELTLQELALNKERYEYD